MFSVIILPALLIGGLGLLFGIGLAYSANKFQVEVDPRVEMIIEALPGANCGACGMPGCAGYAEAIVHSGASIDKCAPGGAETAKKIADIMGAEAGAHEKRVAFIHCSSGGCNNTNLHYKYEGVGTCVSAISYADGPNLCRWGCVFQNDCLRACPFGAITLDDNGMRIIDPELCTACGKCVKACPRNLIELVPFNNHDVHIVCSSHDKGPEAKRVCGSGKPCIGCGLCVKNCPVNAIRLENNLAIIDYKICTNCGKCATVCPTKCIIDTRGVQPSA